MAPISIRFYHFFSLNSVIGYRRKTISTEITQQKLQYDTMAVRISKLYFVNLQYLLSIMHLFLLLNVKV